MNFLQFTLCDYLSDEQKATVLLSATCKGNDPKLPLCPLFHGSLGPMLFSDIRVHARSEHDFSLWVGCEKSPIDTNLQSLLVNCNNITWVNHVYFPSDEALCQKICETLSKTRYSSRSVKSVTLHSKSLSVSVPFIKSHCRAVEEFRNTFELSGAITDFGLLLLSQFSFIKKLILSSTEFITDEGISSLINMPNLQELSLLFLYKITDVSLLHISKIKSLRKLDLEYEYNGFTEAGLAHLAAANSSSDSTLESLSIDHCDAVRDVGLSHIGQLSSLKELEIRSCPITDEGLRLLVVDAIINDTSATTPITKTLQRLVLKNNMHITADGLKQLAKLGELRGLYLEGYGEEQIDLEDALFHVSQIPKLEELYMDFIDERGMKQLMMNVKDKLVLRRLHVVTYRHVSDPVIEEFKKTFPNCEFES